MEAAALRPDRQIRLQELRPRLLPCAHDRAGIPHAHLRDLLACIEEFGVPGFDVAELKGGSP